VYVVRVLCTFASTQVKKRRARSNQEMINRYLLDQDKCN
jgi:hypothetical protein